MPTLRMEWTPAARAEFETLQHRATQADASGQFKQAHNAVALALMDLDQALAKGEPLYETRQPGGFVRHWVCQFISVAYVVFPEQGVGWIVHYRSVPESWPF